MKIAEAGLSLTIPDGWCSVLPDPTFELVAAFMPVEDAGLRLEDCPCGVVVSVEPVVQNLHEWVSRAMARNVGQGHPDLLAAEIAGRPAILATWTDGIRDIASWFVLGGTGGVRLDALSAVDFTRTTPARNPEDVGGHFVRTVVWLPFEKKHGNGR